MVGAKGFEPSTSCSRSTRANRAALRPDVIVFCYYFMYFKKEIATPKYRGRRHPEYTGFLTMKKIAASIFFQFNKYLTRKKLPISIIVKTTASMLKYESMNFLIFGPKK